ncbi:hypothetical protein [Acidicapsa acidisoli]|uniref:hypothetical protein n=1 Tax=Acidicapsa acidisoli TaxID=1615681 RepID=UPI0021DFC88F|nr:hypothetical protein [Acidicapsa acidisoli]
MTVNLLKRLESSVASFRITLKKLQQIHLSTLGRIENFRKTGQDGTFADISATFEDASPDEDLEFFDPEEVPPDQQTGGKVNIQLGDMDLASWEHDLKADLGLIETLLSEMEKVSPADDAKLQHLKEHIQAKIEAPINPGNRKVLVFTAFADTADYLYEHLSPLLRERYGKRVRFFIYNSKELHELESFSADAGINVMVINAQAFNARGKDARRIYEELDDFQTRRPIDVIARNRPILILDEPQKMEGAKTVESLKEFKPLFILRYSATHKQEHNRVYRLDALDAYNRKLVKKIAVRGISLKGQAGTSAYLYLQGIDVFRDKPPVARVELEMRRASGIKADTRNLAKGDNLHAKSGELDQYKGFVVSDINALDNTLSFTNGVVLSAGDAVGDVNETVLRRLQIREAVAAHFEKEQQLFAKGIKVLSLFFIDEVAKYRVYQGDEAKQGEYAQLFEEEYNARLNEILSLEDSKYNQYLRGIPTDRTHEGYFSVDKRSKRLVDPETAARSTESDDVDAYDLILKNKARLLSLDEPVRFLFSHSALREGWDNPNVFVIGMLKKSDNTTTRRQEVGRGLRLSVNQNGDRMDDPATVHELNVLTVVASEGYKEFVAGLQKDIAAVLSARPQKADEAFFTGKVLKTATGDVPVTPQIATMVTAYLLGNDYVDDAYRITLYDIGGDARVNGIRFDEHRTEPWKLGWIDVDIKLGTIGGRKR